MSFSPSRRPCRYQYHSSELGGSCDPLDPTKGEVERKRSGRGEMELRERELLFGGASSFGMQEGGDEAKSVVLISASGGGDEGDQKAE